MVQTEQTLLVDGGAKAETKVGVTKDTWLDNGRYNQSRDGGGRSQGVTPSRRARIKSHSEVEGGKNCGGALLGRTRWSTEAVLVAVETRQNL